MQLIKIIHQVVKMTIQDYYDITGESLTKTTDQTVESAHQFVDKVLRRSNYIVKDVTCKEHGDKLFRGTDGFSSKFCFKHNFCLFLNGWLYPQI